MTFLKRIFLFMAVNFLVVMTISLVLQVLGVKPYLTAYGMDYESLAAFCLVWGMGGSLISLMLSKVMAKWMMGVKILDPNDSNVMRDPELSRLVGTVHNLARSAGLSKMPEVGIYESPELNAFATGPSSRSSLVAVSTGLLNSMSFEEVEGVLGHEIAHVANGDMVTMTLIQGVVNAFVMFFARVIAFAIDQALRSRDDERERGGGLGPFAYMMVQMALEMVFMILGSMVVATFSRWREFRADKGGATLAGREKMIAALKALQRRYEIVDPVGGAAPAFQSMKISGHPKGIYRLFSTHPALEDRIARLQSFN